MQRRSREKLWDLVEDSPQGPLAMRTGYPHRGRFPVGHVTREAAAAGARTRCSSPARGETVKVTRVQEI